MLKAYDRAAGPPQAVAPGGQHRTAGFRHPARNRRAAGTSFVHVCPCQSMSSIPVQPTFHASRPGRHDKPRPPRQKWPRSPFFSFFLFPLKIAPSPKPLWLTARPPFMRIQTSCSFITVFWGFKVIQGCSSLNFFCRRNRQTFPGHPPAQAAWRFADEL